MSELRARFDLPLDVQAPAGARRMVRQLLGTWGFADEGWLDQAAVVVAELVTNAVRHGGGLIELELRAHESQVTLSAADGSSVIPRRREPGQDAGGFGLALIERFSAGWGVENFHGGKRVWVRLAPYPRQGDGASRAQH